MEFFTREICVCAHLTQTRDALEKCAEMRISVKKVLLKRAETSYNRSYLKREQKM